MSDLLAPGIRVVVRDWLSANHVLITGRHECALIDTGYGARVEHTLALLRAPDALGTRRLDRIVNTHCHSDHMGGNAAIAREYGCPISLPADAAPLIECWDTRELLLDYADQEAERFACEATIAAGDVFRLGETEWQALAAPGHDMTALAFYAAEHRILVSGDALWKRGFGLIEPVDRLEERLAAARATLERIAGLGVAVVIPGHGTPFTDVDAALEYALKRLDAFSADPLKAARHCLKSLFVFALLARGAIARKALPGYFAAVPCYREYDAKFFHLGSTALGDVLTGELLRSGAIVERGGELVPAVSTSKT